MGFVKAEKYREQRRLQVEMCLKLEHLASVYSHGDRMVDISRQAHLMEEEVSFCQYRGKMR